MADEAGTTEIATFGLGDSCPRAIIATSPSLLVSPTRSAPASMIRRLDPVAEPSTGVFGASGPASATARHKAPPDIPAADLAPAELTPAAGDTASISKKQAPAAEPTAYGRTFWLCYLSNAALTAAAAILYRYSDFVAVFGGGEFQLGWIVGIGMIGSLIMRYWLGTAIDRLGPRRVWLASQALFAAVVAGHIFVTSIDTPAVYALRMLYCIAVAGVFGSSITFISHTIPQNRMAEVLGTLGTSGFLGMAIGPALGDWLSGGLESSSVAVRTAALHQMFLLSSGLGVAALLAAAWATRGEVAPVRHRRRPNTFWLLRKYVPGALLAVGFAMGVLITLPSTFLRAYTAHLDIHDMQLFFFVYTPTAFIARLATRRMSSEFGIRPMIIAGLCLGIASVLSYLAVDRYAMLALPALLAGCSHALLFPTLMAGGAMAFPNRHRGLATTLMLASMDVGTLIGAPLVGGTRELADWYGLPAYGTVFTVVAVVIGLSLFAYARSRAEVR
jgi:MFS family permease